MENYMDISSPMGVAYTSGYRAGKMTYAYVKQTDVSFALMNFHGALVDNVNTSPIRSFFRVALRSPMRLPT